MKKKGRREREKGRQISEAKREREGGRKPGRRSKGKQRYVHILYTCSIHRHTQTCTHIDTHINTYTDRHTHLSFSMNFAKSLLGGLGMRWRHDAKESSSDPNPLYGGTCGLTVRGVG